MAALVLGCLSLLTCKLSTKSRARREREAEYNAQFEELKAENAKRVRQLSKTSHREHVVSGPEMQQQQSGAPTTTTTTTMATMNATMAPPSYEDVTAARCVEGF